MHFRQVTERYKNNDTHTTTVSNHNKQPTVTNTRPSPHPSYHQDEDEDDGEDGGTGVVLTGAENCHIIKNPRTDELNLAPLKEERE